MNTPLFPAFRARLAALGRRTVSHLRQDTLQQLAAHLAGLIPAHLLSSADEGPNSRERLFTLRLTATGQFLLLTSIADSIKVGHGAKVESGISDSKSGVAPVSAGFLPQSKIVIVSHIW